MTLWDVPNMVLFWSGFFFHKWRSGDFPEFGHNQLSSRDISFTWHHVTDVMVPIGSLGDDVTGDHDVIGCPIYVTSSQAKNWIMDFFPEMTLLHFPKMHQIRVNTRKSELKRRSNLYILDLRDGCLPTAFDLLARWIEWKTYLNHGLRRRVNCNQN